MSVRVLVVGAGGLVGAALVGAGAPFGWRGLSRAECDVTRATDREAALRAFQPDAVVFAAAFTDVDGTTPVCAAVNVDAPAAWSRQVETWFFSSNFVFDGAGPHAPGARPRPANLYAEQKVAAEAEVLGAGGHVVRLGWVYGPGGRTFASTARARLSRGETVRAIHDVLVQPTHADDVARAMLPLPRGITHLAGREETSWYGYALAVQAQVRRGRVEPVRSAELGLGPRPRDGRLAPAELPGWRERLGGGAAEAAGG